MQLTQTLLTYAAYEITMTKLQLKQLLILI